VPVTVAVTGTTMEQLLDADMVPPERLSEEPPLVMVTVPPQVFDAGDAAVFFILVEGYVSVKAAPVMDVVLGLMRVIVMIEAPLIRIVPGLMSLTAVGGAKTVSRAETALPGNVLAVVTTPVLLV
jgi:hypothetical protein